MACTTPIDCGVYWNNNGGISVDTSVVKHTTTFKVKAQNCYVTPWAESNEFQITVSGPDCSTNLPTQDPASIANLMTYVIDGNTPTFQIDHFTSSYHPSCDLTRIDVSTSEGISVSWHSLVVNPVVYDSVTNKWIISLVQNQECSQQDIKVFLRYKFSSDPSDVGLTRWLDIGEITLRVVFQAPQLIINNYPTGMTKDQRVDVNDNNPAALTAFYFSISNPTTFNVPQCPYLSYYFNNTEFPPNSPKYFEGYIYPNDKSLHKIYYFMWEVYYSGFTEYVEVGSSLDVGCSNVIFTQGTGFQQSIFLPSEQSSIVAYTYSLPTTELPYCQVTQTQLVDITYNNVADSTAAYIDPLCTQPCTTINMRELGMQGIVKFKVQSTIPGGFTYTDQEVQIILSCESITDYFSTFTYDVIRNSVGTVVLPSFQCPAPACCNPVSYQISPLPSGTTYSVPGLFMDPNIDPPEITVTDTTSLNNFTFYLYGQTSDRQASHFSPMITIRVQCPDIGSLSLHLNGYPTNLGPTQNVELSNFNLTHPTEFKLNKPTSDCSPILFSLVDNPPNLNLIEEPTILRIVPVNIHFKATYTFRIKVTSFQGYSILTDELTLSVGDCRYAVITPALQSYVTTVAVGGNPNNVYIYNLPSISMIGCKVIETEIVDVKLEFELNPTAAFFASDCLQPCTKITLQSTSTTKPVRFKIKSKITDGLEHISKEITISKECLKEANIITSSINSTIIQLTQLSPPPLDRFVFEKFECTQPVCCQGIYKLSYKVSEKNQIQDNKWKVTGIQSDVAEDDGKMVIKPQNMGQIGDFNFFVYAENPSGSYVFSQKLTLKVIARELPSAFYASTALNLTAKDLNDIDQKKKDQAEGFIMQFFTSRIESIDSNGKVVVRFSDVMMDKNRGINITQIDSHVLDVKILPCQDTLDLSKKSEFTIQELLEFEWEVIDFYLTDLVIQLNFSKPLMISNSITQRDMLQITILEDLFFKDVTKQLLYFEDSKIMTANIRKQVKKNKVDQVFQESQQNVQSSLYMVGAAQVVISFFVGLTLNYFIAAMNVIQINTFQSMINVNMPANAMTFQSTMASLLNIEIISPEITTEKIMDTKPDYAYAEFINENKIDTVLSAQIQDIGFETFNPQLNVGGLFVLISIIMIEIAFLFVYKLTRKLKKFYYKSKYYHEGGEKEKWKAFIARKLTKHRRNLTFNLPILLFSEALVQTSIAGFLFINLPQEQWEIQLEVAPKSAKGELLFCYFCLMVITLYILHSVILLVIPLEFLPMKKMRKLQGQMYRDLKINSKMTLFFRLLFGVRRVLLSVIAVYMQKVAGMQVVVLMYFNLFSMIYLAQYQPFREKTENRIEAYNESCIYLTSILLSTFSDYYDDVEMKYSIGWFFIAVCSSCIFVNFSPLLYKGFRYLRLYVIRWLNHRELKKKKFDNDKPCEINIIDIPEFVCKEEKETKEVVNRQEIIQAVAEYEKQLIDIKEKQFISKRQNLMQTLRKQLLFYQANFEKQKQCIANSKLEEAEKARVVFEMNAVKHLWKEFVNYERYNYEYADVKRIINLRVFLKREISNFKESYKPLVLEAKYHNISQEFIKSEWNWENMLEWFRNLNKVTLELKPHMFFEIQYSQDFKNQPFNGLEVTEAQYQFLKKKFQPKDCKEMLLSDFNIFCQMTPQDRQTTVLNLKWTKKDIKILFRLLVKIEKIQLPGTEVDVPYLNQYLLEIWNHVKEIKFDKFQVLVGQQ